ncbi:hypothetical protein, conserved [Eimeria acervulina]|uniref:Uncharacterized protein n=1 Tax=Eimeria acervulina TaxID=5801 RepID=U6GUD4_EIMAC|nr:hypothetical protein, conserved [Eimeria acervulina]CDI82908.1 hypothetical protein, conserved [Eimeria acervulina]
MKVTPGRPAERCTREYSALEKAVTESEKFAESFGSDLAAFCYPFENNVDFVDTPAEETEGSPLESDDEGSPSVPPTPPSTPMNKPERPEGGAALRGPPRDQRPAVVSRRAWHKLRRLVERQEKEVEEKEKAKLCDEVTGRRDQSREAEEARHELCGHRGEEAQLSPLEESATETLQRSSSSSEPWSEQEGHSTNIQQDMDRSSEQESHSTSIQQETEADELQKEEEMSFGTPSTSKGAVNLEGDQLKEQEEEKPAGKAAIPLKSGVSRAGDKLHRANEELRKAPKTRKSTVSWHPVAEVVTVEAGSPTTQFPITRTTADLAEKSTLRSCRRMRDRANVELSSNSSSSTAPFK